MEEAESHSRKDRVGWWRVTPNAFAASRRNFHHYARTRASLQKFWGGEKDGSKNVKNLLNRFLFLLRILSLRFCRFLCSEGDPKSRRSHPTRAPLPREKQKSGAAIGIWRVSDPAKEIPFFSETRHLRILSAVADPHFAVPEFCGAGSMPSRSRTDRNLDRQNPKGRCRILWLWDLEQNS